MSQRTANNAPPVIRILLVDDHFIVCAGLKAGFSHAPDLQVIAEAEDGRQAIALYQQHHPDIVLMDLRLPELDGLAATAAICQFDPNARVIIFSTHEGDEAIASALRAGARGYVSKTSPPAEFCQAIRSVYGGKSYLAPSVKARLANRLQPQANLTSRETEVLRGIARGLSNREIAEQLLIGEGTVIEDGAMIKGPAIIGRNCEIRHGAYLRDSAVEMAVAVVRFRVKRHPVFAAA